MWRAAAVREAGLNESLDLAPVHQLSLLSQELYFKAGLPLFIVVVHVFFLSIAFSFAFLNPLISHLISPPS